MTNYAILTLKIFLVAKHISSSPCTILIYDLFLLIISFIYMCVAEYENVSHNGFTSKTRTVAILVVLFVLCFLLVSFVYWKAKGREKVRY